MNDRMIYSIMLVSGFLFGPSATGQEEVPKKLDALIFEFEVVREELRKPIATFQENYAAALDRLKAETQSGGQLERVLAVVREREGFVNGEFSEEGAFPELLKLREIYQKGLEQQLAPVMEAEDRLRAGLIGKLNDLKTELTKSSRLDEAVMVAEKISLVERRRTLAEEARKGLAHFRLADLEQDVEVRFCKVERVDGAFVIEPLDGQNVGKLITKEAFAPPFVAVWNLSTDGGNMRFYYAGFLAFLNHESGRRSLEVRDPVLGRSSERMIPELGRVSADEFHEIKLIVDRDRYAFVVNGEVRAEGKGDYSGLAEPVAFGPAYGSRLTLRRFEIHR